MADNPGWKITRAEVLMGREAEFPLTPELEANLLRLLAALNVVRDAYGKPMRVSSGYRPGRYNEAAHGAKHSFHLSCQACDFVDPDGALDAWCMANLDVLRAAHLQLEHPSRTAGWCHLDLGARPNTVFLP